MLQWHSGRMKANGNQYVAEVGVMQTQTDHSCSCIECCTAGESLSLYYYTIGLDLT